MGLTVADVIRETTRAHLLAGRGKLFGQCVTAVGWIGGTVPELTEQEGIIELSMADVSGAGIAVGAALVPGQRPIYVIRYQGFMWYNAASILNYAAKSKEMWGVPCPLAVRSIAMEGAIGPVASGCHHFMPLHMPGIKVAAPMTPKEWASVWQDYLEGDDPIYISEHRRSFPLKEEMPDVIQDHASVSLVGISASRLEMIKASEILAAEGIVCNLLHLLWLKPLALSETLCRAIKNCRMGLVIDSDYEFCGASESVALRLMHATGRPIHALGLEDRSAGFAPRFDNPTPTAERIVAKVKSALKSIII